MELETLKLEAKKLHREKLKALANVAKVQYKITELEVMIADCELEREIARAGEKKMDSSQKKRRCDSLTSERSRSRKARKLPQSPVLKKTADSEPKSDTECSVTENSENMSPSTQKTGLNSKKNSQIQSQCTLIDIFQNTPPITRDCTTPIPDITIKDNFLTKIPSKSQRSLFKDSEKRHSKTYRHTNKSDKTKSYRYSKKSVDSTQKTCVECKSITKNTNSEDNPPVRVGKGINDGKELQETNTTQINIMNNPEETHSDRCSTVLRPDEGSVTEAEAPRLMCHIPIQLIGRPTYRRALKGSEKPVAKENLIAWCDSDAINNRLFEELRNKKPLKREPDVHSLCSATTLILIDN